MAIIKLRPTSPGTRFVVKPDRSHLHKGKGFAPLLVSQNSTGARNSSGRITTRHKGGGHKQKYRIIDFRRDKDSIVGVVEQLEYDPNRTAHIAPVLYKDGERRYILAPKGMKVGNAMQLRHIPVGSSVHNIELKPGKGGQIARAAGNSAQFTAREGLHALIR